MCRAYRGAWECWNFPKYLAVPDFVNNVTDHEVLDSSGLASLAPALNALPQAHSSRCRVTTVRVSFINSVVLGTADPPLLTQRLRHAALICRNTAGRQIAMLRLQSAAVCAGENSLSERSSAGSFRCRVSPMA